MARILTFGKWRQEDRKFKNLLGYTKSLKQAVWDPVSRNGSGTAVKKTEIGKGVRKWMEPENITLSEVTSPRKTNGTCSLLLVAPNLRIYCTNLAPIIIQYP
ncbi:hypothetical protein STEG23_010337, partial [Scotinomys teguina]